jgi:hypothetical protein
VWISVILQANRTVARTWLMIFDNLEHDIPITEYVPKTGSGSILLTSRDPDCQYGLGIQGCRITSFGEDESTEFLYRALPNRNSSDPDELRAAKTILKGLGGLPLGIRQIGGFIRESGSTIKDCATLLTNKSEEREIFSDEGGFSTVPYSSALLRTWRVSINQLDKGTLGLLSVLSFFDPDSIQRKFLSAVEACSSKFPRLFPDMASPSK